MPNDIQKKLFGTIPVQLEPKEGTDEQYQLVSQDPPQEVTKAELKVGLINTLRISNAYWKTLPDTENQLTKLEWDKPNTTTSFTLAFQTSPLFDLYKNVIEDLEVQLEANTQKEILE